MVTEIRREDAPEISLTRRLKSLLSGRVCVLGVGNRERRDDGVGSLLAERLVGTVEMFPIDAGSVPENYLEKAARWRPDTVLIVDATDFGGVAGEARILDPSQLGPSALSTHALSLRMAADYLTARTGARLALLAIQPADVGRGTELSEGVCEAIERLVAILSNAFGGPTPS